MKEFWIKLYGELFSLRSDCINKRRKFNLFLNKNRAQLMPDSRKIVYVIAVLVYLPRKQVDMRFMILCYFCLFKVGFSRQTNIPSKICAHLKPDAHTGKMRLIFSLINTYCSVISTKNVNLRTTSKLMWGTSYVPSLIFKPDRYAE